MRYAAVTLGKRDLLVFILNVAEYVAATFDFQVSAISARVTADLQCVTRGQGSIAQ